MQVTELLTLFFCFFYEVKNGFFWHF